MTVVKQTLDSSGAETAVAADVAQYKFTLTAGITVSGETSSSVRVWPDTGASTTATATKTQNSTEPLSGSYKIQVPLANGSSVTTEDISIRDTNGIILRKIYKAAPEYIGKIEVK